MDAPLGFGSLPAPKDGREFVSPPLNDSSRLDACHTDSPVRYCSIYDVLGRGEVPSLANRVVDGEGLLLVSEKGEPRSFAETQHDQAWQVAMREEMDSIEQNGTWSLAKLPHGLRPTRLKWVKFKKNEMGAMIKHKAHLIAKGYVQQQGINFDEVFVPMARLESVRLLLAVATQES